MEVQREDIETRIMSKTSWASFGLNDILQVNLGIKDPLLITQRAGQELTIHADNRRTASSNVQAPLFLFRRTESG